MSQPLLRIILFACSPFLLIDEVLIIYENGMRERTDSEGLYSRLGERNLTIDEIDSLHAPVVYDDEFVSRN